jgi:hypothetical protein
MKSLPDVLWVLLIHQVDLTRFSLWIDETNLKQLALRQKVNPLSQQVHFTISPITLTLQQRQTYSEAAGKKNLFQFQCSSSAWMTRYGEKSCWSRKQERFEKCFGKSVFISTPWVNQCKPSVKARKFIQWRSLLAINKNNWNVYVILLIFLHLRCWNGAWKSFASTHETVEL